MNLEEEIRSRIAKDLATEIEFVRNLAARAEGLRMAHLGSVRQGLYRARDIVLQQGLPPEASSDVRRKMLNGELRY